MRWASSARDQGNAGEGRKLPAADEASIGQGVLLSVPSVAIGSHRFPDPIGRVSVPVPRPLGREPIPGTDREDSWRMIGSREGKGGEVVGAALLEPPGGLKLGHR